MPVSRAIAIVASSNGLLSDASRTARSSTKADTASGTSVWVRNSRPATDTGSVLKAPTGPAVLLEASTTARCTLGAHKNGKAAAGGGGGLRVGT